MCFTNVPLNEDKSRKIHERFTKDPVGLHSFCYVWVRPLEEYPMQAYLLRVGPSRAMNERSNPALINQPVYPQNVGDLLVLKETKTDGTYVNYRAYIGTRQFNSKPTTGGFLMWAEVANWENSAHIFNYVENELYNKQPASAES